MFGGYINEWIWCNYLYWNLQWNYSLEIEPRRNIYDHFWSRIQSLINTNNFISLDTHNCDDPIYPKRDMVFVPDNFFIPISIVGLDDTMMTHTTMDEEMDRFPYITMLDYDKQKLRSYKWFGSVKYMVTKRVPQIIHRMIKFVNIFYLTNEGHHKCLPEYLACKLIIGILT